MNKIEKMIKELCPNGVDRHKVGDVIKSLKTGLNPRSNFKLNAEGADCYYITGKEIFNNKINVSDKTDLISKDTVSLINKRAQLHSNVLLFASTGTGTVGRMAIVKEYKGDWNVSETLYIITTKEDLISIEFLMYILYSDLSISQYEPKISKGSVPHLKVTDLLNVQIPLPPLPIQTEIVRILDKFVEQQEQLERLIELRKKQYEYYREEMLKPKEGEKWKTVTIGDLGTITRGRRFVRDDVRESGMPCIHYGDMYTYYGITARTTKTFLDRNFPKKMQYAKKGDVVVVGAGENDLDIGVGTVWEGEEPAAVHDACYILEHKQNPKYIAYFLRTNNYHQQLRKYVSDGKICSISGKGLGSCIISIPSLKKQEGIVEFLDKFESSIATLTSALEASKKRYEYYRDEMLGF